MLHTSTPALTHSLQDFLGLPRPLEPGMAILVLEFVQDDARATLPYHSRRLVLSATAISWIPNFVPGRIAQSVTCLATDACLTADQGVASSIPVRPHTFVEIDHEMILLLPLIHSRRVVVSYKRKYVHELLVNRLFKPAQEKVWLGELTVPQWP